METLMNIRERASRSSTTKKKQTKTEIRKRDEYNSLIWKKTDIPEGFILVVDTREQYPLFDPIPKGLCIVRDTVKIGDYTVKGLEDKVAIERKMESDFFNYIGKDRDNTIKKLESMSKMYFSALVYS